MADNGFVIKYIGYRDYYSRPTPPCGRPYRPTQPLHTALAPTGVDGISSVEAINAEKISTSKSWTVGTFSCSVASVSMKGVS